MQIFSGLTLENNKTRGSASIHFSPSMVLTGLFRSPWLSICNQKQAIKIRKSKMQTLH